MTIAAVILALATTAVLAVGAGGTPQRYYVAIGASQTLGYQPMGPGVQRGTDKGYTNDLLAIETARWPGLRLVTFACPGIRVDMALTGRTTHAPGSAAAATTSGRCRRRASSEVGAASAFIHAHPGQVVLVTVDLGYPDVGACLRGRTVDEACVADALARVRAGLPRVVSRLRAAGASSPTILGLDFEDPTLGTYLDRRDPDHSFAEASLRSIERLDRVVKGAYERAGVGFTQVSAAFATGVATPALLQGRGTVPLEVQRICTLTWVCTDGNPHPNALGYRRIASAVALTLASTGG